MLITDASELSPLRLEDWGLLDYSEALERQAAMVAERLAGRGVDTLVLVEHPAVVTLGRRGSAADLRQPEADFPASGVALRQINRGGLATAHEPGQLVVYPIVQLKQKDLRSFANCFLQTVIALLAEYGLQGHLKDGEPGVWVNGRKICSFGIALKKWISSHGIALNVNNDLSTFNLIVPCGRPQEQVTSVAAELGGPVDLSVLKARFVQQFLAAYAYTLENC